MTKHVKMEDSIKLIRIPLIITGFDIFNDSNHTLNKVLRLISRLISYLSMTFVMLCFCYAVAVEGDFSDLMFNLMTLQAFVLVLIQLGHLWHQRDQVIEIFDQIKGWHSSRDEEWAGENSRELFDKCSIFVYKLCK